jgi:AI-2 transport protein TqsA
MTMNPQRAAMALIVITLTFFILWWGKTMLIPLAIAATILFLINILSHAIHQLKIGRMRLPETLCFVVALVTILTAIGFTVNFFMQNIDGVITAAPGYQRNLEALILRFSATFGMEEAPNLREMIRSFNFSPFLLNLGRTVTTLVGNTVIIVVFLIFLIIEQRMVRPKLKALINNQDEHEDALALIARIRKDIRTYLGIKFLTSLLTGICSFVVLKIVGVDFAGFWAILIFMLNFIPTLGSIVATIFPSLLALVQFETLAPFVVTVIALSLIQFSVGNLLEPRLMGNSLNISPIVILLSLGLWGQIWNIPGMFLCVPITAIIMIVFSYFPSTRPFAVILSGNGEIINTPRRERAATV